MCVCACVCMWVGVLGHLGLSVLRLTVRKDVPWQVFREHGVGCCFLYKSGNMFRGLRSGKDFELMAAIYMDVCVSVCVRV